MKDPIPNVRFTVAKIIHKSRPFIDPGVFQQSLLPGLKELASDSDRDVQYFASLN
jgi:hypothetical protein